MSESNLPKLVLQFGPFQVNLATRELRKHGLRVRLPGQPFCVLSILLEKPGEVVTREDIRQRLWASDTFVDYEHSLNSAIKKLRAALGDSPEHSRYVETVPRVGYRFIAPVEEVAAPGRLSESASEKPARIPANETPSEDFARPMSRRRTVAAAVVLTAVASLSYWFLRAGSQRQPSLTPRATLAVLPFANLTGDSGQDYLTDGLTDELISQLGRLDPEHLAVIGRTSVMRYKQAQPPADQIGRELNARYVLEGSFRHEADRVRVSAKLIQTNDQTQVWSREYDREAKSLLVLQSEVALEIADEIELTLGTNYKISRSRMQDKASPNSYAAYDLYLHGRYFWNKRTPDGFRQAADYFQKAVDQYPNYARAYAGLADTYGLMSTWSMVPQQEYMPKAREAALHALQLDSTLAEAHTSLALVAESYDYDWQTAEKEFRRAIELDPAYPTAHQWYGEFLGWQGRFDEAFAESERARQLDPLAIIVANDYGTLLYLSRRYDRAIAQDLSILEMDSSFIPAFSQLISSYVRMGRIQEAEDSLEKYKLPDNSPWMWAARAEVFAAQGKTLLSNQAVSRVEQIPQSSLWLASPGVVGLHAALGHKDLAIQRLQKAYAEHSNAVLPIKVEPALDPLRDDPRFQDLLRQLHLDR